MIAEGKVPRGVCIPTPPARSPLRGRRDVLTRHAVFAGGYEIYYEFISLLLGAILGPHTPPVVSSPTGLSVCVVHATAGDSFFSAVTGRD